MTPVELSRLLEVREGITALMGSGGKTTAMYLLAEELSQRGTVICTTSTHIVAPDHIPVLRDPGEELLAAVLMKNRVVCAGSTAPEGKLTAPSLPWGTLASLADVVLVEADGSRQLSQHGWRAALSAGRGGYSHLPTGGVRQPHGLCAGGMEPVSGPPGARL